MNGFWFNFFDGFIDNLRFMGKPLGAFAAFLWIMVCVTTPAFIIAFRFLESRWPWEKP